MLDKKEHSKLRDSLGWWKETRKVELFFSQVAIFSFPTEKIKHTVVELWFVFISLMD
jgi:hypothetical protein